MDKKKNRVVSYARRLRFEWQTKENRRISIHEAASRLGINRNRLSVIELNKAEEFKTNEIARFCEFYSKVLGRRVLASEVIGYEYDDDDHTDETKPNKRAALSLA